MAFNPDWMRLGNLFETTKNRGPGILVPGFVRWSYFFLPWFLTASIAAAAASGSR